MPMEVYVVYVTQGKYQPWDPKVHDRIITIYFSPFRNEKHI